MMHKTGRGLIGLCSILLMTWSSHSVGQERADILTLGGSTAITTLNPAELGTSSTWAWLTALGYDSLLWFEPDGTYSGNLASDWGFTDDNSKFNMTIRPGVTFQDGTPLDAEAVAASLNYAFGNAASRARLYAPGYKTTQATGPLDVTVNCDPACPSMPWLLTQVVGMGAIISPKGLKDATQIGTAAFGSGPYVLNMGESTSGDTYVFDANDDYWNQEAVHYERVVLKVISDENARILALQTGQVDLVDSVSPQQATAMPAGTEALRATFGSTGATVHDTIGHFIDGDKEGRTYSEPLAKIEVRQALNYAIDREALTEALGRGFGTATSQFSPPGTTAYVPELDNFYTYDPQKAKALLVEAGYPDGFTLDMTVAGFGPGTEDWSQAIASYWEAIGVKVNLDVARTIPIWVQEAQLAPVIYSGGSGSPPTPFAANLYYQFNKGTTYSQWNPDDQLVEMVAQQAVASAEDMTEIHQSMVRRAVEQGYWIAVARLPGFFGYNPAKVALNVGQDMFAGVPIVTRITPAK